jgi:hypothetical protein
MTTCVFLPWLFLVIWNINVLLVCVISVHWLCVCIQVFITLLLFLFGVRVRGYCLFMWPVLKYNFFVGIECVLGCILEFLSGCYSIFFYLASGVGACMRDCVGLVLFVLAGMFYALWCVYCYCLLARCGFVCVLLFCVVVVNGVKYKVSKVKQYFIQLYEYILLMWAINMEFLEVVHVSSFLGYLYYFHRVLYISVRVSCV